MPRTPIYRYRPTRQKDFFGSVIDFGTPIVIWGDVERGEGSTLAIDVLNDEDVQVGDVLVLKT